MGLQLRIVLWRTADVQRPGTERNIGTSSVEDGRPRRTRPVSGASIPSRCAIEQILR